MGTYAFAGGKGGVGKTTTALNVGVALADSGYETVVVDADLGMCNLGQILDSDGGPGIHDVLAGTASVAEALVDGPRGVTVLPGQADLDAMGDADPAGLSPVLNALARDFEFVLIDTGAGLSHEVLVVLGTADWTLIVTTPDEMALDDAAGTVDIAAKVDGDVLGTVVTRATPEGDRETVEDRIGRPLLGVVPDDTAVASHEIVAGESAEPDTAAAGYRELAKLLESCELADDAREAVTNADPPTMPASIPTRLVSDRVAAAAEGDTTDEDHEDEESDDDASEADDSGGFMSFFR